MDLGLDLPDSPPVELRLLGRLALRRHGSDVALPASRKVRALLAYLALAPHALARSHLCELLWDLPNDPRGELRWCLSKIRGLLDAPGRRRVEAQADTVRLDLSDVFVDALAVSRAAQAGFEALPPERLRALAGLFAGPFLDGLEIDRSLGFTGWLTAQRRRLHELQAGLLERLAAGAAGEALGYLERWLAIAPFEVRVHGALLRALARRGRLGEAEAHLAATVRRFEAEGLDVAPLREAWRAARAQHDTPHPARAIATGAASGPRDHPEPAPPPAEDPLDRPAVAVLPFTNMSGDPEQAYFADGVTEDIITTLSYWRCFPVIARNSTFAYKGRAVDVAQVAKDLGARYVLEGSVRKAGNRVRISAQLIDAATAHHLWAERYDRDLGDIFDLQDEITRNIVASIEPQLNRAEQQRALRKRPENLDAWDCSLRALWHIHKATRRDFGEAERLLQRAIASDPTSSYAYALVALRQFLMALSGWTADPPRVLAGTLQAAQEAVALDGDDWLPHALLGIALLWTRRQHEQALAEEERAIALNPSAVIAHQFLGCVLAFAGQPAEAIPHLETVLRLDPRYQSPSLILADLALCQLLLGRPGEAAAIARRAVEQQPGNVRAHQRLAAALGHLGSPDEAAAALNRLLQLQPGLTLAYVDATYPFSEPGHREIFVGGLQRAGWREAGRPSPIIAGSLTLAH